MIRITPAERAAQIRRKLADGAPLYTDEQMMNSGRRRTTSKRELLARLDERARERGQEPWPRKG